MSTVIPALEKAFIIPESRHCHPTTSSWLCVEQATFGAAAAAWKAARVPTCWTLSRPNFTLMLHFPPDQQPALLTTWKLIRLPPANWGVFQPPVLAEVLLNAGAI